MKALLTIVISLILLVTTTNAQNIETVATVKFKSFVAGKQLEDIKLTWQVSCNIQYALFEIFRSDDGITYKTIHSFKADQLRCNKPFDYIDKTAVGQVFYKIKTGDIDGKYSTEKIVSAHGKEIVENNIKIISPALKNTLQFIITAIENGKANILISNTSGNLNKQVSVNFIKGISNNEINVADLPRGIYSFTYIINDLKKSVRFLKS